MIGKIAIQEQPDITNNIDFKGWEYSIIIGYEHQEGEVFLGTWTAISLIDNSIITIWEDDIIEENENYVTWRWLNKTLRFKGI